MQVWDSEKLRRGRSCVFVVERTMSWSSSGASAGAGWGEVRYFLCENQPTLSNYKSKTRHEHTGPGR
jgi:hypothetical protein